MSALPSAPALHLECVLEGHTDRVWYASWHPTRELLATCSGDKSVRIWQPKPNWQGAEKSEPTSTVWRCVGILDDFTSRTVRCCEWSPDGKLLACTSFDGKAYVWSLGSLAPEFDDTISAGSQEISMDLLATLEGHENEVKSCAWSPTGSLLATCGRDKTVWLWGLDEQDADLEVVAVLNGHAQDVKAVRWHPSREILFSASYDDTIKVWGESLTDWICLDTLSAHSSTVWDIDFFLGGSMLASASDDLSVAFWHGRDAKRFENPSNVVDAMIFRKAHQIPDVHTRTIFSISCQKPATDSTQLIATSGADDTISIHKVGVESIHDSAAHDPAAASTGVLAAPAITVDTVLRQRAAHTADVNCVRWHPRKTNMLVSCGDDSVAKIWRLS